MEFSFFYDTVLWRTGHEFMSMNSAHLIIVHSPGCKHIAGCVLVSHCSFAFIVQGNNVYFLSEKWDNDENAL